MKENNNNNNNNNNNKNNFYKRKSNRKQTNEMNGGRVGVGVEGTRLTINYMKTEIVL